MEHGPRYRYALVIHARSVCECGHAFTLKREACITVRSPIKCKRALESMEDVGDKVWKMDRGTGMR